MYGRYCKNRFCTICSAIRKADTINRYYPAISKWPDVHFVTLTVRACKEEKLDRWIYGMLRAFELILNRCKKVHQRGKEIKLIGIKSLECNFNPMMQTYNPHYHIIVPSREVAVLLKKEWLKQWRPNDKSANKYKYTSPAAQDLRPVVNLEMALIEPIKYRVQLLAIPSNLGKGLIWYFICPHTGKRCRKLHLVGKYFYHRTACRGLYENQTKSKYYKILEKAMGGGYKSDQLFEQLYKKNFKKQYAGKPTKKYLKLTQQIQRVESIPAHEIERALLS